MKLVYIAGPYRAPTPEQKRRNIRRAYEAGVALVAHGIYPVIPHKNTENMDETTSQPDQFFLEGTLEQLRRADALLLLPGWELSEGARSERAAAEALGLPAFESVEEVVSWHGSDPLLPTDARARKAIPVYSGFLRYFPRAVAAVAHLSYTGNEQHNPGTALHWDRTKSGDELDALCRHLLERDWVAVAWRAMANLEKHLEREAGLEEV